MYILHATIKAPHAEIDRLQAALAGLGVESIQVHTVSFAQFAEESRLNWDCVYQELWEAKAPVAYLDFYFEDSEAGRKQAYNVEFHLPQIPLNLRYDLWEDSTL